MTERTQALHTRIHELKKGIARLTSEKVRLVEERDQAVLRAERAERAERTQRLELDNLKNRLREARELA